MNKRVRVLRALAVCACVAVSAVGAASARASVAPRRQQQQDKSKETKQPQASQAELQAARAVESAADAAAALAAAGEFLKKHDKSSLRPQVAQLVAGKIANTQDPAQRVTLAQTFRTTFTAPGEADQINPVLLDAYLDAKRYDDAFQFASTGAVERFPNPVNAYINLTIISGEEAKKQNGKFVQAGQQFGQKAIEMIEADRRPAGVADAAWGEYKTKWLPQLYQTLALLSFVSNDTATARTRITKAAQLNPTEPFNYVLMGTMSDREYQALAQSANAASASDEARQKALAKMDEVIDAYARVMALTEGNAGYEQIRQQMLPVLTNYYKFRHKGSTDGLQQLIDKYKKPGESKPD